MKKQRILFIPLDERPCNYLYPKEMAACREDVELIMPDPSLLSHKKEAAEIEKLWQFVEDNISHCDAFVLSVEMLFYGGLLPSRLHHLDASLHESLLLRLKSLKANNRDCRFYAFQLIMRTPRYSSSDEEPDYYGLYGKEIFERAYLLDKSQRIGLHSDEASQLEELQALIPEDYILDYETRRHFNLQLNLKMLSLVDEGVLELLSIPQDDSCEFGYTAMDQKEVVTYVNKHRLERKAYMYPGADEAGCSLIARAVSDFTGKRTVVYPMYASYLGPQIIPLYEDRLMIESLKSHLLVCGCEMTDRKEDADFILAINSPGKMMQESWEQQNKDITYSSFRNLHWFCETLSKDIHLGHQVVVADCAYANGGDLDLIHLLDDYGILDQLYSYKGWNTHCNTLGTSIAQMVICDTDALNRDQVIHNLIYHLLDDGFYQPIVRKEITEQLSAPLNYFDLKDQQEVIAKKEAQRLQQLFNDHLKNSFQTVNLKQVQVHHPWNRMFEIGMELCVF